MKSTYLFFLSLLLLWSHRLYTQISFDIILSAEHRNLIYEIELDQNNNYYCISNERQSFDIMNTSVIRVSSYGDTLIKTFYSNQDTLYFAKNIIFDSINSEFFVIGIILLMNNDNGYPEIENIHNWIFKVDTSLNILWQNFYSYPEIYQLTGGGISNSILLNNRLYCFGNIIRNWVYGDVYLLKLDLQGNLLQSRYTFIEDSTDYINYSCHGLLPKNDTSLVAYVSGSSSINTFDIIEVDTSLNLNPYEIINEPSFISSSIGNNSFVQYENNYLVCTRALEGSNESIAIGKIDSNYQYTDWDINSTDYEDDCPAKHKSVDYYDLNRIFIGGTHDTFVTIDGDHWVYLAVYDSNLTLQAMKFYGEGYGNHSLMSIKATSDGGCFMAGGYRDYLNAPPYQNDIWLKKVTYDDLVGLSEETADKHDYDALLFPNPVEDCINVLTVRKGLELRLYDISGKQVLQKRIISFPTHKISAEKLKAGTYLYRLYDVKRNYEIQNGKLIKQ